MGSDGTFTNQIREQLFRESNQPFGMDLMALNVQRGRDHGLASYSEMLKICQISRAASWNDLLAVMDSGAINRLKSVYDSVQDVDLFVGGALERNAPNAQVGPTWICIIGDTFARLQRGDRFYYELGGQGTSFSQGQLAEIRRVSLARILCDNSEHVDNIQPLAMFQESGRNHRTSCQDTSAIPRLNLQAWRQTF